jgi:endonuclease-3 related protein
MDELKKMPEYAGREKLRSSQVLEDIYRRLLTCYGPQHWWPANEPFEVMVGAVLTQSTAWINVEKAIRNLKEACVLSPSSLRSLGMEELASLIRSSGYYNVKAKKLGALVEWLKGYEDYLPEVFNIDIGRLRGELLQVYGIGEETADSILLYAAGKPVFVIDAYTRRTIDRIGINPADRNYAGYQRLFIDNLPHDARYFNEYHALLVRHGKTACRKQPRCLPCCLREICHSGLSSNVRHTPVIHT